MNRTSVFANPKSMAIDRVLMGGRIWLIAFHCVALQILHCPQYDKNQRPIDKALRWLPLKLYIMKNLVSLGVFLLILLSVQVNAQEQSVLQIRPTGRILMDGGLFHSDNKNFVDGVAIPDARIGVKATYGKYKAKVDIGYAYGKVSLKTYL